MTRVKVALRIVVALLGLGVAAILLSPIFLAVLGALLVARLTETLARQLEPSFTPWEDMLEYEPVIGWKPRALLDTRGCVDELFHVVTDAEGWRGRGTLDDADVLVVGDSFAFGHGTDEADFFANLLDAPRVKAIGANGYTMVHELLWMHRLRHRLRGKLVIWLVYFGNDLYENLQPNLGRYRMPFLRRARGAGWELATDHIRPDPWTASGERSYYHRLAEICSATPLSRRAFSACAHLVSEGRDVCAAAGARLVVVTVPEIAQVDERRRRELAALAPADASFDAERPDREMRKICDRLSVPFVALGERLGPEHYKSRDVHWNARGQRAFARTVAEIHRDLPPTLQLFPHRQRVAGERVTAAAR